MPHRSIKNFAASGGQKAGEFYTPPEVSELLARLLDPQPGESICDPACGSASLLMKCGKQVTQNHNGSKDYALYGQEAIGSTWSFAKMNMFLHGEDNHRIEWGDTIRNPKLLDDKNHLMRFDVVTANPPFSLDKWGHEDAAEDVHHRFARGVPPKTKGDYAFILHMIDLVVAQQRDNPVFYVQYAHARCRSVLRAAAEAAVYGDTDDAALASASLESLTSDAEMALIRRLAEWPRMVEAAALAREPHRVAFYLADVAGDFHALWNRGRDDASLRFLQPDAVEATRARLALVAATAVVIRSGLAIMGVEPVEEMR